MKIPAHAPLHLLHQASVGTLATHTREPQGFPYPTVLPFAPDARHRPVILISNLAEHTRNLLADTRAGFLVVDARDDDVLNGQRATLVGRFEPVESTPALTQRYLRYHPGAQRYLALGDFTFWRMAPERLRYIAGFGTMGWLDAAELDALAPLDFEEELALLAWFEQRAPNGAQLEALGVDRYGIDLNIDGMRSRFVFDTPKTDPSSFHSAMADCIANHR